MAADGEDVVINSKESKEERLKDVKTPARPLAAPSPPLLPMYKKSDYWSNTPNIDVNDKDILKGSECRQLFNLFHISAQTHSQVDSFAVEVKRMAILHGAWRVTEINNDFTLCRSYPRRLIVPATISDEDLLKVASFRYSNRIPTVVWRHEKNGCIIARSSQPEVGWLGWRSDQDEILLNALVTSCISSSISFTSKKLLVIDARSYAAAVANRAKGGGCECPEYYPCSEVLFMGLANIHSVRKSFQSLRALSELPANHTR